MTALQEQLLELLMEIDEICRDNDIEYYIDGGTALGAVRHRGFLPWDDDIDIMMTRSNWEKFRSTILNNPKENRVLEDLHNNEQYTMVYARYCDTNKTCILRTSMIDQFKSGLFIDVFILDPIPDTQESKREYFEILGGYAEYLNPFYYDNIVGANEWYDKFCEMGRKQGRQAVIDYVEKKLFSYPDEEGMTYGFRYDNGHFIYPRDVVGRPVRVPFENQMFPIAENSHDYMRIHFGDSWNIIPTTSEMELHNVVIDLDVPYEQFKNTYIGHINRNEAVNVYNKLHESRVEARKATETIDKWNYNNAATFYAQVLSKRLEQENCSIKELILNKEYDTVRELLGNYYTMQLHRWFMFYQVLVPITDEQMFGALYLLLVDGEYSKADKILNLRKLKNETISDDLIVIEQKIESIRNVVRAFEHNDPEAALQICNDQLDEDFPQYTMFSLRAKIQLALLHNDRNEAEELREEIDKYIVETKDKSWIYALDLMLRICFADEIQMDHEDEYNKALEDLQKLAETCRDGLLRLAITDFIIEKGLIKETIDNE